MGAAVVVRVGDEGMVQWGYGRAKGKEGVVGERFIASGGGGNSGQAKVSAARGGDVDGRVGLALQEDRAMALWHRRSEHASPTRQRALGRMIEMRAALEWLVAIIQGVAEAVRRWHGEVVGH